MKTFGQPGSITPASFRPDLHRQTVKEGLLLLREMGLGWKDMCAASGFSRCQIREFINEQLTPLSPRSFPDYVDGADR